MKTKKMNEKGFSLTELLTVVAIIGILTTVAVPGFRSFQAKARQSEAKALLGGLYTAERTFRMEWGTYFGDFRNIGFYPEGNLLYRVGFASAGITAPAGYTGPGVAAGIVAVKYDSKKYCDAAVNCAEVGYGSGAGTIRIGSVAAASTFRAEASGDIDGDSDKDIWTIDQQKTLTNAVHDLN